MLAYSLIHSFHIAISWYIPENHMTKYSDSRFQTHTILIFCYCVFQGQKLQARLEGQFQSQRIFRAVALLEEY